MRDKLLGTCGPESCIFGPLSIPGMQFPVSSLSKPASDHLVLEAVRVDGKRGVLHSLLSHPTWGLQPCRDVQTKTSSHPTFFLLGEFQKPQRRVWVFPMKIIWPGAAQVQDHIPPHSGVSQV